MNAQARRFKNGAEVSDRRTLAVGAGNMNNAGQPPLGTTQRIQQPVHPVQRKINLFGM